MDRVAVRVISLVPPTARVSAYVYMRTHQRIHECAVGVLNSQ